ncbi:MAG: hypothetical protein ACRC6G_13665 [Deefgea sp.]
MPSTEARRTVESIQAELDAVNAIKPDDLTGLLALMKTQQFGFKVKHGYFGEVDFRGDWWGEDEPTVDADSLARNIHNAWVTRLGFELSQAEDGTLYDRWPWNTGDDITQDLLLTLRDIDRPAYIRLLKAKRDEVLPTMPLQEFARNIGKFYRLDNEDVTE